MDRNAHLERIAERLARPRILEPPKREPWSSRDLRTPSVQLGSSEEDWAERFKAELEALGGSVYLERNPQAASERLRAILRDLPAGKSVSWSREAFASWPLEWLWEKAGCLPWPAGAEEVQQSLQWHQAALAAEAGITTAEWAIAETGTLLLAAGPSQSRSASLLPQHHIALVRRSQLVPCLGDALARITPGLSSARLFITGPSRTSDIENDLTIGVHGPARLSVILA